VELRLVRATAVRRSIAAAVLVGLVSAAGIVVQAVALAGLLASAMEAKSVDPIPAFLWMGGAAAIRAVCAWAGELFAAHGAEAAKAELRGKLLHAVVARTRGTGATPGDVATVAGHGLDALDPYIGRYLPDLVMAASVPFALVVVVGALDWVSALVLLAVVALFPVFGYLVGAASSDLASTRWNQLQGFGRQIADVFEGLPVLKAFGRSAYQRERIAEAGRRCAGRRFRPSVWPSSLRSCSRRWHRCRLRWWRCPSACGSSTAPCTSARRWPCSSSLPRCSILFAEPAPNSMRAPRGWRRRAGPWT